MSGYPESIDQFSRKIDNQDTILANDINELQEAIEKIETQLGENPSGSFDDVKSRFDDLDHQIENVVVSDNNVNLSENNVGEHNTLSEHVKDVNIHGNINSLAHNYPKMLDKTLDEILRGVLSSGYPLNTALVDTVSTFLLEKGDLVFCYPVENPSSLGYGWFVVTEGSTDLSDMGTLRLNNESAAPVFADGSWIVRLQPINTYYEDDLDDIEIEKGSLVFAYPENYPVASSYGWFMATADASIGSEIRLNDEANAPVFASDSIISVFEAVFSDFADTWPMPICEGDIVFCSPSTYPTGNGYNWHIVTYVSENAFRLDGEADSPTFPQNSILSKFIVTNTSTSDDTSMPIKKGDLAYCSPVDHPSSSVYGWHIVTAGGLGVDNPELRLDNCEDSPVFSMGSRFSLLSSESYQGTVQGGEILELLFVPDWVLLNSVGTNTNPTSEGTWPALYGNVSLKFPMGEDLLDNNFSGEALELDSLGDPLTSSAFRPRLPLFSGSQDGYYPETGMRVKINSFDSESDEGAERGIAGVGIINRTPFGELCNGYPIIKAYTCKLAQSMNWLCYMPILARVLDNADNSHLDTGDYVLLVLSTQGNSDSPYISTKDNEFCAADIFKVPSDEIYTGTGEDGELIVDGTYAENSSDGIVYPGGQLTIPANINASESLGGSLSAATYGYKITAIDTYGNETNAANTHIIEIFNNDSKITLTWDSVDGAVAYRVYGRGWQHAQQCYMTQVETEEFIDDGTITPQAPNQLPPVSNTTSRAFLIDTIKNYTNVHVQNGGVISCTPWNNAAKSWGKIVFYATGSVIVDSSSKISVSGKGYDGGHNAHQGESYTGLGSYDTQDNNAGGGGSLVVPFGGAAGGGGYGTKGEDGTYSTKGGETYGNPALDILYRGSGGGGMIENGVHYPGGSGGGILVISANFIIIQGAGSIEADGVTFSNPPNHIYSVGGSGGSIYLRANTLDVGINKVTALGCAGYRKGGDGRIRFDYIEKGPSESNPPAYKYQL